MIKSISKKEWLCIGLVLLVGLLVFAFRIHQGVLDVQGDYQGYVATAQFFAGVPGVAPSGQRLLKPLEPLANAALAPLLGWQGSFLSIVAIFYALLGVSVWLLFKNFFESLDDIGTAFVFPLTFSATALFMLSYPMLRYGLDAYTETGALFFYILGLLGILFFLKKPAWQSIFFALAAATVGFFWKEYVVVPILILQIAVLWHPLLKNQTGRKILYLAVFDGIFLAVNLIWELCVYFYFHYDYFQWYLQGGANHFQAEWSFFIVLKSLFALLIFGWFLVPFGFAALRRQSKTVKMFFWLILLVPLVCLGWGAVSSRLFYVCVPALAILAVLGAKRWYKRPADLYATTVILLAVDWVWLLFHL